MMYLLVMFAEVR